MTGILRVLATVLMTGAAVTAIVMAPVAAASPGGNGCANGVCGSGDTSGGSGCTADGTCGHAARWAAAVAPPTASAVTAAPVGAGVVCPAWAASNGVSDPLNT